MSETNLPDLPARRSGAMVSRDAPSRDMVLYDPAEFGDQDPDTIDLREYWRTLIKRRMLIGGIALVVLIFAFISTLVAVPMYRAVAIIQIQENPRIVQFDNLETEGPGWSRDSPFFYNTQLAILRSSAVATAVVENLGIQTHPDVSGERRQRSLLGEVLGLVGALLAGSDGRSELQTIDPELQRQMQQAQAAGRILGRLQASQVRNSRLFQVSFDSFDPAFAVQVVNEAVRQYSRLDLDRRSESGGEARRFLQTQIDEMRSALDEADQSLARFSRESGIANFNERVQLVGQDIRALNEQLRVVQIEKVRLDALRRQIDSGRPIENLEIITESPLVQDLRAQLMDAETNLTVMRERFLDQHPALAEAASRVESIRGSLNSEMRRLTGGVISLQENLAAQETALLEAIDVREGELLDLNQRSVQFNILNRDLETTKQLHDGLLQRMKEIGVAEGTQRETINIIEPARGAFKVYPRTFRTMGLALLFGLILGVAAALLLEFLDNTIKTPDDVERIAKRPVLGLIPMATVKQGVGGRFKQADLQIGHYSARYPRSSVSEAFRSLRTSLMFVTPGGMPKILLMTSPAPGDGKTTCSINLSTVLAQNGARVLLVDADLRKPRIHRHFGKPASPGLTNRLTSAPGAGKPTGAISGTDVPGLFVMTAGTTPPNPAELLGSERMGSLLAGFAKVFDYVIVDSAPIIGIADALVLCRYVQGVILVGAAGVTGKDNTRMSVKRLRQVEAPLLGVVLNAVDMTSPDYAYYSSYYYNYSGDDPADSSEDVVQQLPKSA